MKVQGYGYVFPIDHVTAEPMAFAKLARAFTRPYFIACCKARLAYRQRQSAPTFGRSEEVFDRMASAAYAIHRRHCQANGRKRD
jgi:hypothetical protein